RSFTRGRACSVAWAGEESTPASIFGPGFCRGVTAGIERYITREIARYPSLQFGTDAYYACSRSGTNGDYRTTIQYLNRFKRPQCEQITCGSRVKGCGNAPQYVNRRGSCRARRRWPGNLGNHNFSAKDSCRQQANDTDAQSQSSFDDPAGAYTARLIARMVPHSAYNAGIGGY